MFVSYVFCKRPDLSVSLKGASFVLVVVRPSTPLATLKHSLHLTPRGRVPQRLRQSKPSLNRAWPEAVSKTAGIRYASVRRTSGLEKGGARGRNLKGEPRLRAGGSSPRSTSR